MLDKYHPYNELIKQMEEPNRLSKWLQSQTFDIGSVYLPFLIEDYNILNGAQNSDG